MNRKTSRIITIIVLLIFLTSCAPAPFKPYIPPDIKYDKLDYYDVQETLDMIPKPDKLEPIYIQFVAENHIEEVSKDKASHILLIPKEYAKVGSLVKLAKTYKTVAIEQEILVNTYIDQINALREMLELERQKVLLYRELWVNSENAYRQEKADHDRDNLVNRAGMIVLTIGAIVAVALAL